MKTKFTLSLFDEKKISENKAPEKEADSKQESKTIRDRKAEFEALIKGEYKDLYCEKIREIVAKRLKGSEAAKQRLSKAEQIMEILADRYKTDKDDLEKLFELVSEDDELILANAKEKGVDADSYRYIKNLEKENRLFREKENEAKEQMAISQQMKKWYGEADAVAEVYPEFDLGTEIANEKFVELLRGGVDMKTAYEVVHHEDIIDAIKNKSALDAEKATTERLLSVDRRPVENGMSAQSPVLLKTDVSKLTPQQRASIAKRAAMGETITF